MTTRFRGGLVAAFLVAVFGFALPGIAAHPGQHPAGSGIGDVCYGLDYITNGIQAENPGARRHEIDREHHTAIMDALGANADQTEQVHRVFFFTKHPSDFIMVVALNADGCYMGWRMMPADMIEHYINEPWREGE